MCMVDIYVKTSRGSEFICMNTSILNGAPINATCTINITHKN